MKLRQERLPITGFGATPTQAEVTVGTLTGGERARRAAMGPMLGVGVALVVLPVPLVHLIVPPLALIGGVALGLRRASIQQIFTGGHGPCPFCGTEQTLGLTGSAYRLPQTLKCRSCLKPLSLDAA